MGGYGDLSIDSASSTKEIAMAAVPARCTLPLLALVLAVDTAAHAQAGAAQESWLEGHLPRW